MAFIRIKTLSLRNYRSFGERQDFHFPPIEYKKPVAIVGYNNAGKTNLLNAIKFSLCDSVREDTFELKDFHNNDWNNPPCFASDFSADISDPSIDPSSTYRNVSMVETNNNKVVSAKDYCNCYGDSQKYSKKWAIKQNAPIFYINFHSIKDEISTQKTSWGNIRSFLGKHIQKLVDTDDDMSGKREDFEAEVSTSTQKVLTDTKLSKFIEQIQTNYSTNLRNSDCSVEFGLPNYEDIFLKMLFKIGLNGNADNLIPLDHFGDGFISMFVMAVIQAIAESTESDKCLFLFEEPESFLHENHQEYFYKSVLCTLSEKGHQVIYTTHSEKMIDPFDTKGLIRLEIDGNNQTICKYNNIEDFVVEQESDDGTELINMNKYNEFIKTVEPNLNRMLFSKKVILVEGPNDVLVYKYAIKKKVNDIIADDPSIEDKMKYSETFLNFENISIVCHHGKSTALYLIELCKHFDIEYFAINDWDFEENELEISQISSFDSLVALHSDSLYTESEKKGMITTNWNLYNNAGENNIHFNIKKLESVIGYNKNDKSSIGIWNHLQSSDFTITEDLFPNKLMEFLNLGNTDES